MADPATGSPRSAIRPAVFWTVLTAGALACVAYFISLPLLAPAIAHDRLPNIYSPTWLGNVLAVAAMLFLALGLAGCYWLFCHPNSRLMNPLVVTWTIAPPLYFLFSYHVLFRYFVAPGSEAHYWASQRLYVPVWAGLGALLGLIASDKLRRSQ